MIKISFWQQWWDSAGTALLIYVSCDTPSDAQNFEICLEILSYRILCSYGEGSKSKRQNNGGLMKNVVFSKKEKDKGTSINDVPILGR